MPSKETRKIRDMLMQLAGQALANGVDQGVLLIAERDGELITAIRIVAKAVPLPQHFAMANRTWYFSPTNRNDVQGGDKECRTVEPVKLWKKIATNVMELAEEAADVAVGAAAMELSSAKLAVVTASADALQLIASRFAVYLERGFWHTLGFGPACASNARKSVSCHDDIGGENLDCNCGGRFYYDEGASCWVCENCGRDPSGETV